ncbi:hypothetical protein ACLMJK_008254 [Lecanora helva]
MGTLSDITAQATNTINRRSPSAVGYQTLQSPAGMEKENVSKSSPHFMTPTYSSTKQSAATAREKMAGKTLTPSSAKPVKDEGNNAWMKTAARRVGMRRNGGDGTPRSRKETIAKDIKAISFPDKFATPSHAKVAETPPSTQKNQSAKVSPQDKPLPRPPIVQVASSASSVESRSLIDAGDKPLRRPSSALKGSGEDWPVLEPKRVARPGTLQEMMRDTGAQLQQQAISGQKERYPILGNTLNQIPVEQLPVSRYSASYESPKAASMAQQQMSPPTSADFDDDPFRDGVYNKDLTSTTKPKVTSPSKFSASAPSASTSTTKASIEPRQNRTSSLRARLSAGQLEKTGQSKVPGSTDFTTSRQPKAVKSNNSLRARKEAQGRRLKTPPPIAPSLDKKSSKDSLSAANRAPAQFVAGSRRATHARRPSSRGSIRNESRASTPSLPSMPPNRPVPPIPGPENHAAMLQHDTKQKDQDHALKRRASSIPVSRKAVANESDTGKISAPVLHQSVSHGADKAKATAQDDLGPKKLSPTLGAQAASDIYNDKFPQDLASDLQETPPRNNNTPRLVPFLIDNKDTPALESIEESPQHTYQFKRLSVQAPEYGPTLRISPSANKFIMGTETNKENHAPLKKSSKGLVKNGEANGKATSSTKGQPERPSSSQGISRLGSRIGLIDVKAREKKAKSVDLGLLSPKIPEKSADRAKPRPENKDVYPSSTTTSKASASTNDPFFDAPEEPQQDVVQDTSAEQTPTQGGGKHENDAWISPLPVETQGHRDITGSSASSQTVPQPKSSVPTTRSKIESELTHTTANVLSRDFANEHEERTSGIKIVPSTPQQASGANNAHPHDSAGNIGISSHPPRSSSRKSPPDWSGSNNKKAPSPPTPVTVRIPPPTPPKDFPHRQDNLGSAHGLNSTRVNLTTHNNKNDKKDSWGGPKPQQSTGKRHQHQHHTIPKGNSVLSNLKGLFNKHPRSTEKEKEREVEAAKSITKGKTNKSRATVGENGSPFPPLSEIHPIYRPTAASTNRSSGGHAHHSHGTARSKPLIPNSTPRNSTTLPTLTNTPAPLPPTPALPTTTSTTTTMAMQILDSARNSQSSPQKERLLELGKIMVEGITQARNAEKAMEEARQAARRAEVAQALCQRSLREVGRCVQGWRDGEERGGNGGGSGEGGMF